MPRVTFEPTGRTLQVTPGTSLLAAAQRAGLPIARACGGRGICDSCALRVDRGLEAVELRTPPTANDAVELAPGWVMACLARVQASASPDQDIALWSPAWGEDPRGGS